VTALAPGVSERTRVRRLLLDTVAVSALRRVLDVGNLAGARLAPVKGVVLSRWLYDHISDRPYRDLDLLIARPDLDRMHAAVAQAGWPIRVWSAEMGELEFEVDRLVVEVHGEFGRRDLSHLTTQAVLSRARTDRDTFPFVVSRLDDIDHLLLLVTNVVKKAFTYANLHQAADFDRLLRRLETRRHELIDRARAAGLMTALRTVSVWMSEEHGSEAFRRLCGQLDNRRRPLLFALRQYRKVARRKPKRLASASGLLGLALATLTPDDPRLQIRGLARLVRRGISRRLGHDPG
jgi:hypothetical protein